MNETPVFSKVGGVADGQRWHPGERARVSGKYAIIDPSGSVTSATRFVTKGEPFPPTPQKGQTYVLIEQVKPIYTSVASAATLTETTSFRLKALKELAKK